jgi:predicted AlkP superfamily pyrophosphatase or phosphodiesterase
VLPSVTYTNHASLVTGREPAEHGILASTTFTGAGIRRAREVGARGTTLLDAARSAGLGTAVVAGDASILGVVGAERCDHHWPPGGVLPAGTPLVRGYAANAVTFQALLDVLGQGADVILCQLDSTDGFSHEYGPESPEAVAAHREADTLVGQLLESLRGVPRWRETIVAVISDHCQLTRDLD